MIYCGIVSLGFALVALALGFVGWAPGAAGVVNLALFISVVFFSAAATLGHRYPPFFHRRQTRRGWDHSP